MNNSKYSAYNIKKDRSEDIAKFHAAVCRATLHRRDAIRELLTLLIENFFYLKNISPYLSDCKERQHVAHPSSY